MFSIVEFEDGVLAIPSNWIDSTKKKCRYPPYKLDKYIVEAIKKMEEPEDTWKTYKIKKFFGTAEKYRDAKEKQELAMITSDLDDEKLKKNRHIRKKKRSSSSNGGTEYETEDECEDENMRLTPKKSKLLDSYTNQPVSVIPSSYSVLKNRLGTLGTNNNENNGGKSELKSKKTPFQLQDKTELLSFDEKLDYLIGIEEVNHKRNLRILQELANLQKIVEKFIDSSNVDSTAKNTAMKNNDCDQFFAEHCPITNQEDFEKMEHLLKSSEFKQLMINEFKAKGGKEYVDLINNILCKILTDEMAAVYSFKGKQKKKCFGDTNVCKCLVHTVRNVFINITEHDIEKKIGIWLANAQTRLLRKNNPKLSSKAGEEEKENND